MAQDDKKENGELMPISQPSVASLGDVMNSAQLRAAIKAAETQRQLIKEFVKNQLVEGTDYGVIVGNKPTLLKPGQEKIFSLMKLTSRLEKDADTLDMLGSKAGQVAYLCRVYRGGEEIAQGRGAAVVGDKKRDENATIKIAEKRARMDACLSLGFSEFFTQDLEDGDYTGESAASKPSVPATIKQKNLIAKLFMERGANTPNLLLASIKANGVEDPKNMTTQQASEIIEKLFANSAEVVNAKATAQSDDNGMNADDEAPRGPGDPDSYGYPGQDDVIEGELSDEEIENELAEAERKLLAEDGEE